MTQGTQGSALPGTEKGECPPRCLVGSNRGSGYLSVAVSSPVPLPEQKNWLCHSPGTAHDTGNMTSCIYTCKRHCLQHGQEQKDLLTLVNKPGQLRRLQTCTGTSQGTGKSVWECAMVRTLFGVEKKRFGGVLKTMARGTSSRSLVSCGGRRQAAPGKASPGRAQRSQPTPVLVLAAGFHSNISLSKYLSAESSYQHV